MDEITGYVERITYCSEESGFTVVRVQEKRKRELSTVVGSLSGLKPRESFRTTGRWMENPRFGRQFRVATYRTVVPATVLGIEKYPASGLIKGIGPAMARRIGQTFGTDTLEVIENRPEALSRVPGIGTKRIAGISRAWQEQKEIKEIMIFVQGYGVSAAFATGSSGTTAANR